MAGGGVDWCKFVGYPLPYGRGLLVQLTGWGVIRIWMLLVGSAATGCKDLLLNLALEAG